MVDMAGKGFAWRVWAGVPWLGYAEGGRCGEAPWGIWGDGEGLGRSEVTRRGLVMKMLEIYGSLLKLEVGWGMA